MSYIQNKISEFSEMVLPFISRLASMSTGEKDFEPVEAFLNNLVLENLFKFFSFDDLCHARLVCRQWHFCSLPLWRSRGCIRLFPDYRDAANERKKFVTMSDFLNIFDDVNHAPHSDASYRLGGWPYHNFKLHQFRTLDTISSGGSQFWLECGPWITSLHIFSSRLTDFSEYRDILLSAHTPNLITLKISFKSFSNCNCYCSSASPKAGNAGDATKPNFNLRDLSFNFSIPELPWEEVLSCYPLMEKLEITYPSHSPNWVGNLDKMLSSIISTKGPNKLCLRLPLKTLKVKTMDRFVKEELLTKSLKLLSGLAVPLETLSLDTQLFMDASALAKILSAYKDTLKTVRLSSGYSFASQPLLQVPTLPILYHLEHLTFAANTFRNMDFLLYTPNLKILRIISPWRPRAVSRYEGKTSSLSISCPVRLPHVKSFRYDFSCTPVDLYKLMTWMPHVEELEMVLDNELFRLVCRHWSYLRWLKVQRDNLDDMGLIGNFKDDPETTKTKDFNNCLLYPYSNQPTIRNLKYLTTFIMENYRYTIDEEDEHFLNRSNDLLPTKLTEKSVYHGFLHMNQLQRVSITANKSSFSELAIQSLKKVVPNVNIIQVENFYYTVYGE